GRVADPAAAGPVEALAAAAGPTEVVHVVQRGEGLLDLQERYGVSWRRIAEANYDRIQPDGGVLLRGQTRIYPGWHLRIPLQTSPAPPSGAVEETSPPPGAAEAERPGAETERSSTPTTTPVYEVAKGDWMWHIAERYLGDPERYPE